MYTEFFKLKVKPFELVPNPAFLYQSRSHKKALNYLKYGLHERAGFILLTGEVGSGKTTIVRNIINDMGSDVALSMLFNTKISNKQVLAMINEDFGLNVTGKDKITLLRNLNDFLVGIHAQKRRAVVIIDEAQNLSATALEEIRLLSNLEATDSKLLQIVLVGQPELKKTIAHNELRQLRQRISVHCQIDPLTRSETEDYVYHRLETAGNRNALSWVDGTFDVLFKYSQGVPRLINVFCDFILLAAYVENTTELSIEFAEDVIGDVSWDKHVSEYAEGQAALKALPRQSLVERLSAYEQKMAALEGLLAHRDEINRELRTHKKMLQEILKVQENGFSQMGAGLERTCQHLQMYLTGFSAKDTSGLEISEVDDLDDPGDPDGHPRKGFLGKLLS
jgi:putative secretion ATPase (PEP-CTERM system associated)